MTKKIVLLLFLAGGILAGFYFAQEKSKGVHVAVAADKAEFVVPEGSTAIQKEKEPSSPEANAQLDNKPSLQVDQMMALLNDRARDIYKDTWVHIKEEQVFDIDAPNNGVLPNGEAIPLHQVNDIWYQVDTRGKVVTTVTVMHDENGHVVQVGLCKNGVSWNSATKKRGICESTPLSLDGGFQHKMQWLISNGAAIEKEGQVTLPQSNKMGYQVLLAQKWSTPLRGDAYKKGITQAIEKVLFDMQAGHLVEWQTIFRFEDGSERVYRRVTWDVSVEPLSPEAEKLLAVLP